MAIFFLLAIRAKESRLCEIVKDFTFLRLVEISVFIENILVVYMFVDINKPNMVFDNRLVKFFFGTTL